MFRRDDSGNEIPRWSVSSAKQLEDLLFFHRRSRTLMKSEWAEERKEAAAMYENSSRGRFLSLSRENWIFLFFSQD